MKIFRKKYVSLPSTQPVCIEACKEYLYSGSEYKAIRIDAEEQPEGFGRHKSVWTHFKGNICTSIGFKIQNKSTLPLLVYYPGYIFNKYFKNLKTENSLKV